MTYVLHRNDPLGALIFNFAVPQHWAWNNEEKTHSTANIKRYSDLTPLDRKPISANAGLKAFKTEIS